MAKYIEQRPMKCKEVSEIERILEDCADKLSPYVANFSQEGLHNLPQCGHKHSLRKTFDRMYSLLRDVEPLTSNHVQSREIHGRVKRDSGMGSATSAELHPVETSDIPEPEGKPMSSAGKAIGKSSDNVSTTFNSVLKDLGELEISVQKDVEESTLVAASCARETKANYKQGQCNPEDSQVTSNKEQNGNYLNIHTAAQTTPKVVYNIPPEEENLESQTENIRVPVDPVDPNRSTSQRETSGASFRRPSADKQQ